MSHAVWKYGIPLRDDFSIDMPCGAKVLHVDVQHGIPCMWAYVSTEAPLVPYAFRLAGTGHPIDDRAIVGYIGSFLLQGGDFVFHLFHRRNLE